MVVTSKQAILFALLCSSVCLMSLAADEKSAATTTVKPTPADQVAADDVAAAKVEGDLQKYAKLFVVPRTALASELVAYVKTLSNLDPPDTNPELRDAYLKKVALAILDATQKALASKEIADADAEFALEMSFESLDLQRALKVDGVDQRELKLAEEYRSDKREKLAAFASEKLLMVRLRTIGDLKAEDQKLLVDEAIRFMKGDGQPSRKSVRIASQIGSLLEETGNEALAATAYEKFADFMATANNPAMRQIAGVFRTTATRLRLPGKKIDIEGNLVSGKAFDWSAYQGKVVLVEFWSTLCKPCIQEFPNIKRNYYSYHSKGFDVVAVSLDEDQGKLETFIRNNKFPWSNLYSHDPQARGWDSPLVTKFGVTRTPFSMLVGKDGKVIAINVFGKKLSKALAEQLGEPDQAALNAAIEAEQRDAN
jgi:peroxiredoxin